MTQSGLTSFNLLAVPQQTLHTPLSRILAERIQRDGPMTFADWMDQCLYHEEFGYYRRGQPTVGRDGDFLTSPEVHPIFGAAVGHVAYELWRQGSQGGQAEPFRIAEVGPGTGALAESMLRHSHLTSPEFAQATRYTMVEPDDLASQKQSERLSAIHIVHRVESNCDLPARQHLVVANELLDALPVHRLQYQDRQWRELLVGHTAGRGFHDVAADVSDEQLTQPLSEISPSEGQIVEVGPSRSQICAALVDAVADDGLLLLFDYDYTRERLYAPWRRDGTLMTFRNHVPGDDPYAHPGEQDITAHIDTDQVTETALANGLTPLPILSQAEWLHNLGAAVLPAVGDSDLDTNAYLSARRAAETLTDPAGLGRIAVMGFTRGSIGPLPGWTGP